PGCARSRAANYHLYQLIQRGLWFCAAVGEVSKEPPCPGEPMSTVAQAGAEAEAPRVVAGQIEAFLWEMVPLLEPEEQRSGRGAPRVLPSMLLWVGLMVSVLRGYRSQADLWRLLSLHGLRHYRFA